MNLGYMLSGGAPVIKKYKVGATVSNVGVPLLDTSTATAGVRVATVTSLANAIGVSQDTATYTTTQATTMVEGVISCIINPDAVWRAKLSGGAAEGTQLLVTTNSVASSGGTLITITTGDADPSSPTMLDGQAYGLAGNNVALTRTITAVAATTATVVVPFPRAVAVSDTYLLIPFVGASFPAGGVASCVLTTNLYEVRANSDNTGDAAINVVDVEIQTGDPRGRSFLHMLLRDHVLNIST